MSLNTRKMVMEEMHMQKATEVVYVCHLRAFQDRNKSPAYPASSIEKRKHSGGRQARLVSATTAKRLFSRCSNMSWKTRNLVMDARLQMQKRTKVAYVCHFCAFQDPKNIPHTPQHPSKNAKILEVGKRVWSRRLERNAYFQDAATCHWKHETWSWISIANAKTHESGIRMPLSCFPRQPRNAPQSENTKNNNGCVWFLGVVHNEKKCPGTRRGLTQCWRWMLAGCWLVTGAISFLHVLLKNIEKPLVFQCFFENFQFSVPRRARSWPRSAKRGPRWTKRSSKMGQDRAKMSSRWPRWGQDGRREAWNQRSFSVDVLSVPLLNQVYSPEPFKNQ